MYHNPDLVIYGVYLPWVLNSVEQLLGNYVYVVNFERWWLIREGRCILESTIKICGNLALMDSLGILKEIDPPILDAASQDFNLSKFCAIWGQEMKGVPFRAH